MATATIPRNVPSHQLSIPWDRYIYLHGWLEFRDKFVGKYTNFMDPWCPSLIVFVESNDMGNN